MGSLEDWGMNSEVNENAIDEIVAACNGDIRGALKALMLVNEHLEAELQQLHAAVAHGAAVERGSSALH
jgi:replication-associated recombination protein RarA